MPKKSSDKTVNPGHWFSAREELPGGAPDEREKALLEGLVQSIPDGILIVSPAGRLLYFNEPFVRIWNLSKKIIASGSEEAALLWAAEQTVNPPAFIAGVTEIYSDPHRPPVHGEIEMKNERVFERYGAPVRRGDLHYGWVWAFRDVTVRKKIERELRDCEQRLIDKSTSFAKEKEFMQQTIRQLKEIVRKIGAADENARTRLVSQIQEAIDKLA